MKAIVVGAGIAGMATALALNRVGYEVRVLEKAPQLRVEGAGISLWSNAVRALQELRVDERVLAAGTPIRQAETFDHRGNLLTTSSLVEPGCGAPSLCVLRGDLLTALFSELPAESVAFDCSLESFEANADEVSVQLSGGQTQRADILVGADGIHSTVRDQLLGAQPPREAGTLCWRGSLEWASPRLTDGTTRLYLGPSSQLGLLPCGPGRVYWFAARSGSLPLRGTSKSDVLEFFGDWAAEVVEVLKATAESDILFNEIVDRPPCERWSKGRVTLLGDAIHSTTPNLGQGGCQALESAVTLAHCLRVHPQPEFALKAYAEKRRARTAWVTRQSWLAGKVLQLGPLTGALRNRYLASGLGRWSAATTLERLIGARLPPLP